MTVTRATLLSLALALANACRATDSVAPAATVQFVLDAPLCSSRLPVQFFIDATQVASDTFVVGLNSPHTVSREFSTVPGRHTVAARVVGGFVWPDTVVTLGAGAVFVDSLPFYCS